MLTAAFVLIAGVGLVVLFARGSALDKESKAYAEAAVRAIAADWKKAELLDRATPELLAKVKPAEMDAWFESLSRLGRLIEFAEAKGQSLMSYRTGSGSTVTANYVVNARFQNGDATFRIGLLKYGDEWRIHGFFVDLKPATRKEQAT